ncbi:MAG: hypothetical protein QXI77_00300 [Nanopusillaceae archaeon]
MREIKGLQIPLRSKIFSNVYVTPFYIRIIDRAILRLDIYDYIIPIKARVILPGKEVFEINDFPTEKIYSNLDHVAPLRALYLTLLFFETNRIEPGKFTKAKDKFRKIFRDLNTNVFLNIDKYTNMVPLEINKLRIFPSFGYDFEKLYYLIYKNSIYGYDIYIYAKSYPIAKKLEVKRDPYSKHNVKRRFRISISDTQLDLATLNVLHYNPILFNDTNFLEEITNIYIAYFHETLRSIGYLSLIQSMDIYVFYVPGLQYIYKHLPSFKTLKDLDSQLYDEIIFYLASTDASLLPNFFYDYKTEKLPQMPYPRRVRSLPEIYNIYTNEAYAFSMLPDNSIPIIFAYSNNEKSTYFGIPLAYFGMIKNKSYFNTKDDMILLRNTNDLIELYLCDNTFYEYLSICIQDVDYYGDNVLSIMDIILGKLVKAGLCKVTRFINMNDIFSILYQNLNIKDPFPRYAYITERFRISKAIKEARDYVLNPFIVEIDVSNKIDSLKKLLYKSFIDKLLPHLNTDYDQKVSSGLIVLSNTDIFHWNEISAEEQNILLKHLQRYRLE